MLLHLTINECHLYVQFGLEFRSEFVLLQSVLLGPMLALEKPVPVLFQTATVTRECLDDLQQITGVTFQNDNLLWSSNPSTISRRSINIDLVFQESPLRTVKNAMRWRLYLQGHAAPPV